MVFKIGSKLQSFVLLAFRVTWGWELLEAGHSHLTTVPAMVERFKGWGVPFPTVNVYISGSTEMIGGVLLILGLATRFISVPLIFNFIVAYATASKATFTQLFGGPNHLEAYDKFIDDSAFPMLILALTMFAFGPGKFAIDHLFKQHFLPRPSKD
jgi:putative oxidoreductase